jgi:hypothetical protein
MDAFDMDAIGRASINELDFRTQLGTQSGPNDFEIERLVVDSKSSTFGNSDLAFVRKRDNF